MKPEYVLTLDDQTVTSWSNFQLACECTQTVIGALAIAQETSDKTKCKVALKCIVFGSDTRYLIEADITGGNYDMTLVKVEWKEGAFIEL